MRMLAGQDGHGVVELAQIDMDRPSTSLITQIFAPLGAIRAMPAAMPEPRHANALADGNAFDTRSQLDHPTNDLVTKNYWVACAPGSSSMIAASMSSLRPQLRSLRRSILTTSYVI
jgi:hypothetical protein